MEDMSKLQDSIAILSKHKDSEGHKAMVELAKQRMSLFMTEFMDGEEVNLLENRANFRAWRSVVTLLEQSAFEYEGYIARVLEEQNRQSQMAQRGMR